MSPSRIDSFLHCELRTVLQDLGARDDDTVSASLGTLIHEIAAAASPDATLAELAAALDEKWPGLDFGARWFAANEHERAERMLADLHSWLAASRTELELVEVEQKFRAHVGDAVLTGAVDRLERDNDGRLVVVDLKTTKSRVKVDDLPTHPQLGAYQLAIESGAFGEAERSGGARLVQLAKPGSGIEQTQQPLRESDDPDWIRERVAAVAARMRGSEFTAQVNTYCGNCDLQKCCPLYPAGRQVTS